MKKIREKIQKFRVSEKGFTLIELIVVIAIIGILAAIGTVAYSGYIESANQAADEQLMYDVSYAIKLGAADEGLTDESDYGYVDIGADGMNVYMKDENGEYVLVAGIDYTGGDDSSSSSTSSAYSDSIGYYAQALVTDFGSLSVEEAGALAVEWLEDGVGSDWASQGFQSDYYSTADAWVMIPSGERTVSGEGETSSLSQTIAANLETYTSSSFSGEEEALMDSVDAVASTFGGLVGNAENLVTNILNITDEDEIAEFYEKYGIDEDSSEEEVGAAMVLYMASEISSMSDEELESFAETLGSGTYNMLTSLYSYDWDDITNAFGVATAYYYSGYASSDYTDYYDTAIEQLTSDTVSAANASGYLYQIIAKMESDGDNLTSYYNDGALSSDLSAFASVLSILTESYESGDFYSTSDIVWSGTDGDTVLNYIYDLLETYGYSTDE